EIHAVVSAAINRARWGSHPQALWSFGVDMTNLDLALPRYDRTLEEVEGLFELPFSELVFRAAEVHRRWFDPAEVQLSQLLSIKTGGCPENCGYCAQSQHFKTGLSASKLMDAE